jgi:MFS family permease
MLLTFATGVMFAFNGPTWQAFITSLVPSEDIVNAIALNSAQFNLARVIGPAVAGILVGTLSRGAAIVFTFNAASFVAVLVSLSLLRVAELRPRHGAHGAHGARGGLTEGFRYVWNRPDLRTVLVMLLVVNTLGLNLPIFISTMAVSVFHKGAGEFGFLTSIMAIGSVAGALLAARRTNPRITVLVATAAMFGLGLAIAAAMPGYSLFGIALVAVGVSAQSFTTTSNSVLQLGSDPVMRGRVVAIFVAFAAGGTPVGAPIVGWIADSFGPRWAVGVGAAAGVGAAVIGLTYLAKHPLSSEKGEAACRPRMPTWSP